MSVALSSGVRAALSSLQSTAAASDIAKVHLATGKKVNSAIDSPVSYFTANSLNARSSQLSSLLDNMSNGIQTITAASKGLDAITKLVQSAQATVKQAQSDAAQNRPTKAGAALATAAEAATTGRSLKDVALNKALVDNDTTTTNNDATGTSSGNVGIASTTTNLALNVSAGSTTYAVSLSATSTVRDLVNEINKSGIATASVDDNGKLNVTGNGSSTLKIGLGAGASAAAATTDAASGGQNTAVGLLAADASTGVSATGSSTIRSNLVQQFNDVRTQIDQLSKDAGFNGTNLLNGDKLDIVFNEKTGSDQSKLTVQGSTISASNLGVTNASNGVNSGSYNFQDDTDLAKAADGLTNALSSLRSLSSSLGSSLSTVQTRQDFTKSMIDTLSAGADNLVNADQNQEAANLLALQTRQQLSQTALSLSSQADQGVLRLF